MKNPKVIEFPSQTIFRYRLQLPIILSGIVILCSFIVSFEGIRNPHTLYITSELILAFYPNDIANLILGVPLLMASLWLAGKKRLIGFLCWPGALFYMLYSYIPYLIAAPFSFLFLLYVLIIAFSASALIYILAGVDNKLAEGKMEGKVPSKLSGGVLLVFSALILLRQLALILAALIKKSPVHSIELAVWIDDLILACPALISAGFLLIKGKPQGWVSGAGLLVSYGFLALSAVIILLYQSNSRNEGIDISDIAVLLIMAGICFWQFALFLRAALIRDGN